MTRIYHQNLINNTFSFWKSTKMIRRKNVGLNKLSRFQDDSPLPERILLFTPDFLSSASKISLMIGSSSSYSIRLPPLRVLVLPSRCVRPPPPSERINHLPSPPHVGAR